jgi:hypothetical protein
MALTMRPAGLSSGIDQERADIYEEGGSPQHLRWYWSLHGMIGKPLHSRSHLGSKPTINCEFFCVVFLSNCLSNFGLSPERPSLWVKHDIRIRTNYVQSRASEK